MKWMKTISQGRKGFKLLPKEQPCSQGARVKLPQGTSMFSQEKELFLFEDMIVF
jgi:hypothetical protein